MRHTSETDVGGEEGAFASLICGFHRVMRDKIREKQCQGWAGWDDCGWNAEDIRTRIKAQLDKPGGGDPVDIANYCAFWWNLSDLEKAKP